jgi:mono/diheme cytochrome c family protein
MRVQSTLVAAVAMLLTALLLAGCGGDDEAEPTTEAPATEAATTAEETTEETAEEETVEEETVEDETTAAGGEGDAEAGAAVFEEAGCGNCHTLEAAGSTGNVGPNLDDSQPPLDLVVERVTNGAPPMPAFGTEGILDEQQIQDVAAYVVGSTSG